MNRSGRSAVQSRYAVLTAGVVLLASSVTGCSFLGGSGKTPVAAETVTPTPTHKPSPSPTLPAAAKKPTKSSAIAFTKHWFAAYNHATWELTSAELKPLSDTACMFCKRAMQTVDKLKADGHRADGGRVTVSNAKVQTGTPEKGMRVAVTYDQAASTIKDSNGTAVTTKPAVKGGQAAVAVRWTGKQWVVLDIVIFS